MRLGTITVPAVELSTAEEHDLWNAYYRQGTAYVGNRKVVHWLAQDGSNDILLEGETIYRPVIRPGADNFCASDETDKLP